MAEQAAGWYNDLHGRFQQRHWDGTAKAAGIFDMKAGSYIITETLRRGPDPDKGAQRRDPVPPQGPRAAK